MLPALQGTQDCKAPEVFLNHDGYNPRQVRHVAAESDLHRALHVFTLHVMLGIVV